MSPSPVHVLAMGMITAVGTSAPETAASVRAGLSGARESAVLDGRLCPISMALVPESDLPPLAASLERERGLSSRRIAMLRLAGTALRECLSVSTAMERVPVLLGVPGAHPGRPAAVGESFLAHLAQQAEQPFDIAASRLFPNGRAAGLVALHHALALLATGKEDLLVVGGVDSYLDLYHLALLEEEGRLHSPGVLDGFIPGEGAAFLLLGSTRGATRAGLAPIARIETAAVAEETGHRYSDAPYRGDGLAAAFRGALSRPGAPRVETVYAGLNGESFHAKEWGVAQLRHSECFAEKLATEHPMDCTGDVGAALGPMMVGLAAIGMQRGYRRGPCLVWCSSDGSERAAALVTRGG